MHPAIPQLLELQRLDQIIATLRAELDGLPKQLREADAKLNGARAAVTAAKEAHTHGLTQRKKLELDAEQWKGRAKKYREQTAAVKTNEAYKALQHEVANAEAEVAKAEDQVLDEMMALEEVDRRMKRVEADLKEAEQAIAAEKKQMQAQYGEQEQETGSSHSRTRRDCRESSRRRAGAIHANRQAASGFGDGGSARRPVPGLRDARVAPRAAVAESRDGRRGSSLRNVRPNPVSPGADSPCRAQETANGAAARSVMPKRASPVHRGGGGCSANPSRSAKADCRAPGKY